MTAHALHHVLLVDPDDEVRAHLKLYLQMHGFQTEATRGAAETLQALRAGFRPCVVLTDPRSYGAETWQLIEFMRGDSVLGKVPIVLVSDDAMHVRRAARSGIAMALPKPVAPKIWIDAVETQCRYRWWLRPSAEASAIMPPDTYGMALASSQPLARNAHGRRGARSMASPPSGRPAKIARR